MSKSVGKGEGREGMAKLFLGRVSCVAGMLFGAGGILFALLGASANISAEPVGRPRVERVVFSVE